MARYESLQPPQTTDISAGRDCQDNVSALHITETKITIRINTNFKKIIKHVSTKNEVYLCHLSMYW